MLCLLKCAIFYNESMKMDKVIMKEIKKKIGKKKKRNTPFTQSLISCQ